MNGRSALDDRRPRRTRGLNRLMGIATISLACCVSASIAEEQEPSDKEAQLALRERELAELETALEQQAAALKTAEERRSNLSLRQAVLEARGAFVAWRRAHEEYTLNEKLREKGIVSSREADSSRETAEKAELAYKGALLQLEEARLDILREAALISVVEARVYRTAKERKSVDVTLANLSNPGKASVAYGDVGPDDLRALLRVPDIRVSLRSSSIIAEPYVQTVETLDVDETRTLTFALLRQDLDALTVDMKYFDKTVSEKVFLRKDSEMDLPTVSSMNFDQSGQLGKTISYDLVLERLAETEKTYQLSVLKLPPELKVQFKDQEKDAMVSSVKFAQDATKKTLSLDVIIPEEMTLEKLDTPFDFFALALDDESRASLLKLKREKANERLTSDDLTAARIAHERLIFTPKGVGELELISSDLYKEITIGGQVQVRFKVKNTGTVPLRNIRIERELPADWDATLDTEVIRFLDIGSEAPIHIELFPSPDLGVGDYTVRIDAQCSFEGQKISVDEKIVRVHVESKANVIGGVLLLLILAGALVAIAVFLVRLARR